METTKSQETLLKITGITKTFPGVKALTDISFDLKRGEVHALVGENGAGKSTLIKILTGVYQPDCGQIEVGDCESVKMTPNVANMLGIHAIYQENTLVSTLSISENIFLGHEKKTKSHLYNWKDTDSEAQRYLDFLQLQISPKKLAGDLGIAEQQGVQITRALAQEGMVLIMDEPTASFGREEVNRLFTIIESLKAQGKGIIFISHHLEEVFEIADRITVLRDGNRIGTYLRCEATQDSLIADMVGRNISMFYAKEKVKIGSVSLRVNKICKNGVLKDISFEAKAGEILGIYGLVGSGRTELSRVLFGADKADECDFTLYGKPIKMRTPKCAIRAGLSLIPEDRRSSGLVMESSIKENITIVGLDKIKGLFLHPRKEKRIAQKYMDELRIKAPSIDRHVMYLSGGNQQKVVFAKWIFTDNQVFILDEPTRGVDIGAKEEIYKIMVELAKRQKTIIMITSEMPELLSMCDRVLVMKAGEIVAEIDERDINEQTILKYALRGK